MISQQRSFIRLILLPSVFSGSSFRCACRSFPSFVSSSPFSTLTRTTRRWETTTYAGYESSANNEVETSVRDQWKGVSTVLVCGDGDLSYAAWLSSQLTSAVVSMTATVLETKSIHNSVYRNSQRHADHIASFGHEVCFGIDATQLESTCLSNAVFDVIIFNFPHWRGKANHKRNRELLSAFLDSASTVLNPNGGRIQVALCEKQGGATALTNEEWKQSWTAAAYAAEHGLLLVSVEPYKPLYDLSSHRGADRPFRIGSSPELYTFSFPNGQQVDQSIQLCCRHELHLVLPGEEEAVINGPFSKDGLVYGDEVFNFVRNLVPNSIRVEVPIRKVLSSSETDGGLEMIVFLIVYCGERKELTRALADSYKDKLEMEVANHLTLRENRKGRLVSRPFPYPLIGHLINKHTPSNN